MLFFTLFGGFDEIKRDPILLCNLEW